MSENKTSNEEKLNILKELISDESELCNNYSAFQNRSCSPYYIYEDINDEDLDDYLPKKTENYGLYNTISFIVTFSNSKLLRRKLNNLYETDNSVIKSTIYGNDHFYVYFKNNKNKFKIEFIRTALREEFKLYISQLDIPFEHEKNSELLHIDISKVYLLFREYPLSEEKINEIIYKFNLSNEQIADMKDYLIYLVKLYRDEYIKVRKKNKKMQISNFEQNINVDDFIESRKTADLSTNNDVIENNKEVLINKENITQDYQDSYSPFEHSNDAWWNEKQEYKPYNKPKKVNDNPFLLLGFFEFAIISTLAIAFFPWSLLFCVIFFGMETTKLLIFAIMHDALRTIGAVLSILIPLIIGILLIISMFVS